MFYNYALKLYQELESELRQEQEEELLMNGLSNSLEIVRGKMLELDRYIRDNPLKDESEEIQYFKEVYPLFCSDLIFFSVSYNLEKELQLIDKSEWVAFLNEEIKVVPRFFRKNSFLYEYYRLGLCELDMIYFTRQGSKKSLLLPEFPAIDFTAAATASYTFAKIRAYEKFREVIKLKLNDLASPIAIEKDRNSKEKLKWTGDTVNLVELAYGIWLTGQLNNGNASLNQIVRWLETDLHVSIGIAQRRFAEIGGRKRLSQTKFIDQMRDNILQKIENGNQ